MRHLASIIFMCALACVLANNSALAQSPEPRYPRIEHFGEIYEVPGLSDRPDPSLHYRIVIDLAKPSEKAEEPNQSLLKVARLLNLLRHAQVSDKKVQVVCVMHATAAYLAMDHAAYKEKYKVEQNPNLAVIEALKKEGVGVYVCSQSLVARNIAPSTVSKHVELTLSAMTLLATYQLKGYVQLAL